MRMRSGRAGGAPHSVLPTSFSGAPAGRRGVGRGEPAGAGAVSPRVGPAPWHPAPVEVVCFVGAERGLSGADFQANLALAKAQHAKDCSRSSPGNHNITTELDDDYTLQSLVTPTAYGDASFSACSVLCKAHYSSPHPRIEDFFCERVLEVKGQRFRYTAVFDGHGGPWVAEFTARSFHLLLLQELEKVDISDPSAISLGLDRTFRSFNQIIMNEFGPRSTMGSTAAVSLILPDDSVIAANCGDSQVIAVTEDNEVHLLTYGFNASDPRDQKRVLGLGGKIDEDDGCVRVLSSNGHSGINLTRSLGDFSYRGKGGQLLISAQPFITHFPGHVRYLVVFSDGVSARLRNVDVCDILLDPQLQAKDRNPAQDIVFASLTNESHDDTTAVVWDFNSPLAGQPTPPPQEDSPAVKQALAELGSDFAAQTEFRSFLDFVRITFPSGDAEREEEERILSFLPTVFKAGACPYARSTLRADLRFIRETFEQDSESLSGQISDFLELLQNVGDLVTESTDALLAIEDILTAFIEDNSLIRCPLQRVLKRIVIAMEIQVFQERGFSIDPLIDFAVRLLPYEDSLCLFWGTREGLSDFLLPKYALTFTRLDDQGQAFHINVLLFLNVAYRLELSEDEIVKTVAFILKQRNPKNRQASVQQVWLAFFYDDEEWEYDKYARLFVGSLRGADIDLSEIDLSDQYSRIPDVSRTRHAQEVTEKTWRGELDSAVAAPPEDQDQRRLGDALRRMRFDRSYVEEQCEVFTSSLDAIAQKIEPLLSVKLSRLESDTEELRHQETKFILALYEPLASLFRLQLTINMIFGILAGSLLQLLQRSDLTPAIKNSVIDLLVRYPIGLATSPQQKWSDADLKFLVFNISKHMVCFYIYNLGLDYSPFVHVVQVGVEAVRPLGIGPELYREVLKPLVENAIAARCSESASRGEDGRETVQEEINKLLAFNKSLREVCS